MSHKHRNTRHGNHIARPLEDWKKAADRRTLHRAGGETLAACVLRTVYGGKSQGHIACLASFRQALGRTRYEHLDTALIRHLVGENFVRPTASRATTYTITRRGRAFASLQA